jgi:hypothetical protein
MNKQLHTILTDGIPAIHNKIQCINEGGCGCFAYELQKSLKTYNIKSHVVLVDCRTGFGDVTAASVQEFINKYGSKGINTALKAAIKLKAKGKRIDLQNDHVCVMIGSTLYDSEGVYTSGKAISKGLSTSTMERYLVAPSTWNSTFRDNNKSLARVTKVMHEHFANMLRPLTA